MCGRQQPRGRQGGGGRAAGSAPRAQAANTGRPTQRGRHPAKVHGAPLRQHLRYPGKHVDDGMRGQRCCHSPAICPTAAMTSALRGCPLALRAISPSGPRTRTVGVDRMFSRPAHQVQPRLGVDFHVLDAVHHARDLAQDLPGGPARGAEGAGKLDQRRPGAQIVPQIRGGQGVTPSRERPSRPRGIPGPAGTQLALPPAPDHAQRGHHDQHRDQRDHSWGHTRRKHGNAVGIPDDRARIAVASQSSPFSGAGRWRAAGCRRSHRSPGPVTPAPTRSRDTRPRCPREPRSTRPRPGARPGHR